VIKIAALDFAFLAFSRSAYIQVNIKTLVLALLGLSV